LHPPSPRSTLFPYTTLFRSKQARRMLALMDRATTYWHIPNVGRAKGRVLRRLLDRHRPTRAIELGSLLGYSAILIAGSMPPRGRDRKSTRLNSSHVSISYAV